MSKHIETGRQRGGSPIVFKSGEPISVICVASTFTGLSYANNGGKVQITSAGVHGLTTSPAVGANVYVSWSGGTGTNRLYKVLSVDSTTAFTIDLTYVVGLGTPSVAIPGSDILCFSQKMPVLAKNSFVVLNGSYSLMPSSGNRKVMSRIESNDVGVVFVSSTNISARLPYGIIKNINSTSSQILDSFSFGTSSTTAFITTSYNTLLPVTIGFYGRCFAPNETITLLSAIIEVFL